MQTVFGKHFPYHTFVEPPIGLGLAPYPCVRPLHVPESGTQRHGSIWWFGAYATSERTWLRISLEEGSASTSDSATQRAGGRGQGRATRMPGRCGRASTR